MSTTGGPVVAGRVRRNMAWNLAGLVIPLVLAVGAVPVLVDRLGVDRFGVVAIAWALIGYFSILDLGLGRAITQRIAITRGTPADADTPEIVWSLLWVIAGLGAVLGAGLIALAGPMANLLSAPPEISDEVRVAIVLLGFAVPTVAATAALRGVLEAHGAFGSVAIGRVAIGVATVGGPLVVVLFSSSLVPVAASLAVARMLVLVLHFALTVRVDRRLLVPRLPRPSLLRPLLVPAGWMTVSNVLGPVLSYGDRFLIGALLSTAAVAYYATPFDVVTKLAVVPTAISGVLFPAFAALHAGQRERLPRIYDRSLRATMAIVLVPLLVIAAFAYELLDLWLGATFAAEGSDALRWLAAGVFANCVAFIPFALVQGAGRPDLTGWLQLAELPVTVAVLWWLTDAYGIEGAAVAWLLRAAVEALVLLVFARRIVPGSSREPFVALVGGLGVLLLVAFVPMPWPVRAVLILLMAVPLGAVVLRALELPRPARLRRPA